MIWDLIGRFLMWRIRRRKLTRFDREQLDRILRSFAEDEQRRAAMRRDAA